MGNDVIKSYSTERLCELFCKATDSIGDIFEYRGAILDELESRDPVAFEKYLECNTTNDPTSFFCAED